MATSAAPHVLPSSLARLWAAIPLPAWVSECCGLPTNATIGHLAVTRMPGEVAERSAVEFYVAELIRSRLSEILDLPVFPTGIKVTRGLLLGMGCQTRALNALQKGGYLDDPELLSTLTYRTLIKMPNVGMKSLLSIVRGIDAVAGLQVSSPASTITSLGETDTAYPRTLTQTRFDAADTANRERLQENLRQIATSDWSESVFATDLRFSNLIPATGESLAAIASALLETIHLPKDGGARQLSLPLLLPVDPNDLEAVSKWVSEIETRFEEIDRLPLEDLLEEFLRIHTNFASHRLDAILARFGWAGKPPVTLDLAGRMLGLTRERLRQIEKKVRKRIPSTVPFVPALVRAIDVLVAATPIEVEKAADLLRAKGVSRDPFSPESVITTATQLGLDVPLEISSVKGLTMVTSASKTANMALILKIARKKAGASGVVSAVDVAARVSMISGSDCSSVDVSETLSSSSHFRRLLQDWFWATDLPLGRNRLVNVCRTMLSVTSPISITRLRDGVRREYRFRNISQPERFELQVPPADVLRAFLGDHPDFIVNNDLASPAAPLDYRRELSEFDRLLVDVLRSSPSPVLDRATIVGECARRGAQAARVQTELSYSCLVEHVDVNIWSLRGADVNPSAIEALRKANALRPKEIRVRDFGWTPEGMLWIASTVPPVSQQLVIGCPAGASDFLAGQKFSAYTQDGIPCGNIGVTVEGTAYGFGPFQRLSAADPGDMLVVEFNLGEQKAVLLLGSEELLENYGAE